MKERRINLLIYKEDRHRVLTLFKYLRFGVLIYSVLITIYLVVFFVVNKQYQRQSRDLANEQAQLASTDDANSNQDAFTVLAGKISFVEQAIDSEPDILSYYQKLQNTMTLTGRETRIATFLVNQAGNLDFSIDIDGFDTVLAYLRIVENSEFLHNFESLNLSQFAFEPQNNPFSASSQTYTLKFQGKFNSQL